MREPRVCKPKSTRPKLSRLFALSLKLLEPSLQLVEVSADVVFDAAEHQIDDRILKTSEIDDSCRRGRKPHEFGCTHRQQKLQIEI